MAEGSPADTLDIVVRLALAEADREYEAFKKKVETPLRVPMGNATNAPTTGRTFSGQAVTTGPLNTTPTAPVAPVGQTGGLQSQMQAAIVARAAGMGGTGFSPAAGPVPTASLNTMYGDTSKALGTSSLAGAMQAVAIQDMATGAARRRSPVAGSRAAGDWDAFVQSEIRDGLTPAMGPGPMRTARVGSLTSRNPRQPLGSRFFRGATAGSIAQGAFGIAFTGAAVAQQYASEYTQAIDAGTYDSLAQTAAAEASAARQTNMWQRSIGGFLNRRLGNANSIVNFFGGRGFGFRFTDEDTVDESNRTAAITRRAEEAIVGRRQNASFARDIDAMGQRGITAGITAVRNAARTEVDELDAQIKPLENKGLDVSDLRQRRSLAVRRAQQAETELRVDFQTQLANMARTVPVLNSQAQGRSYEASLYDISARESQETIAMRVQTAGMSPADRANALATLGQRFEGERNVLRFEANRASRNLTASLGTEAEASRLRMGGRGLDATLEQIRGSASLQIENLDRSDPNYTSNASAIREAAWQQQSEARFTFNNATAGIGRGLRFEEQSLNRLFARDEVGAQAFQTAAAGVERIASIRESGLDPTGEMAGRARASSLRQLDLQARDYGLSFRGEQVDLQNVAFSNQRDGQNPAEVFGAFAQAKAALENEGDSAGNGEAIDYDKMKEKNQEAFENALRNVVVN